ncbi:MAG: hypothetical protein ACLUEK_14915 [Oscillospiraceae bacterium]
MFAVEYLPGQFDQRADSCAECVQLLSQAERPAVRTAKVYLLSGSVTPEELAKIKHYLINPVESREASLDTRATLAENSAEPDDVAVLEGFTALDRAGLEELIARMGLAMDADDAEFCREYFKSEGREPTVTRAARPRYILVRPLPPHHLRHRHRLRRHRRPARARRI